MAFILLFLTIGAVGVILYLFWPRASTSGKRTSDKVKIIREESGGSSRSSSKGALKVTRKEIPYWKQRGWKRKNGKFKGYYRTRYGSFKGEIVSSKRRKPTCYIHSPPTALKSHSHWACFSHRGHGKFSVHFKSLGSRDVDSAIQSIEKILREALKKQNSK